MGKPHQGAVASDPWVAPEQPEKGAAAAFLGAIRTLPEGASCSGEGRKCNCGTCSSQALGVGAAFVFASTCDGNCHLGTSVVPGFWEGGAPPLPSGDSLRVSISGELGFCDLRPRGQRRRPGSDENWQSNAQIGRRRRREEQLRWQRRRRPQVHRSQAWARWLLVQLGSLRLTRTGGANDTHNQPAAAAREEELTVQPQPLELLASGDTTEHLLEGGESSSNDPSRLVETVSESSSHVEEGSEREKPPKDDSNVTDPPFLMELSGLQLPDQFEQANPVQSGTVPSQITGAASHPPPPPAPPPKPSSSGNNGLRRMGSGSSNGVRIGSSRRPAAWPPVAAWTSASGSRPSSPRSLADCEGYNSADEQGACYTSSYDDSEREHMFEHDLRRVKGFEIRKMAADGNCLFRAVADQVYGDPETYDMARQMCVDYMECI
uniref:ubiquitinyl hydrolase 1 n=1 Tax=Aegilops tauschii TaxID=37682 RepID=M8C072_AEGTA